MSLKQYDSSGRHESDTVCDAHRVYRIKVLMSFMRAGVPISKLKYFRDILEENSMRLTDPSNMLQLVPFVLEEEKSLIKEEIKGKYLSIIFDETSRSGEVLAIVIRYVDQWNVHQRLVRMEFLAKSMTGEEVARQLISTLSDTYGIESSFILAAMRDGASDGALMVNCYEEIVKLRSLISSAYSPNTTAVSQILAPGNTLAQQQYVAYAMSCVQPGIDYFQLKFGDGLNDSGVITGLKELPAYLAELME